LSAAEFTRQAAEVLGQVISKLTVIAVVFGVALTACSDAAAPSDFRVGATRTEVLSSHGDPERRQTLRKVDKSVLGPIEDFWPRVPDGSTVEIWAYPVEGGTIELYFVDDSEHVKGKGFAPSGAVFEGRP
jgi:hypothetical protein